MFKCIIFKVLIFIVPLLPCISTHNIANLPSNAEKLVIHNMRSFDVWGSHCGAYKVRHGEGYAEKIPGIDGHVIAGVVTDAFYSQKYNIYFTVENINSGLDYYALKDGEEMAHKINGLPSDAKLLAIHNLAGVLFFGSSSGAYELTQGQLNAARVPHATGNVVEVKLHGGAGKYDADFITADPQPTTDATEIWRLYKFSVYKLIRKVVL